MADSSRGYVLVDVEVDETIEFNVPARTVDSALICITLCKKSGQVARLRIKAPESVTIERPGVRRPIPA